MKIIRNLKDYIKDNKLDYCMAVLIGYNETQCIIERKRKILKIFKKLGDFKYYCLIKEIENCKRVIKKELNIILNRIGINI